ncbi:MAG: AlkZ family DNA glycosylase [Chloroflexi bacterium]|nr:AlkZ family DNA glycosylase [Chloroflexota bacterium]
MPSFDIACRRLINQHIAAAKLVKPVDEVRWLAAVQAQDYAGAKWSLGLRLQNAVDADIEQAFTDGRILRTHVLRPTWHFVAPADIRWLLMLTAPRVHAVNTFMYRKLELDSAIFKRTSSVLTKVLRGGKQLTRDELRAAIEKAGIAVQSNLRMSYIMMCAELDGIVCSGARRGKQFTYALLAERVPPVKTVSRDEALTELARRFFLSRGPATVQDFSKWSGLTIVDAKNGLEAVRGLLRHQVVDGQDYWLAKNTHSEKIESPQAYLLSIYDEYISGYKDHAAILDPEYSSEMREEGNAISYIIVIDGRIVGSWRRTLKRDAVVIETRLFKSLSKSEEQAVVQSANKYGGFVGLSVALK